MVAAQIIVIFDGMCNLCDATVNHLQRHDADHLLRYIPFQSDEGISILRRYGVAGPPDSVYVVTPEAAFFTEDLAMIFLFKLLGGWHKPLAYCIQSVPGMLRRPVYRWMSQNRYAIFGKRETCRV
ncbi:MAG: thiol-disulfide oxidoreductase DCC family protein [Ignavibacteria bacterium]|jgi:predicted DCC family thiol-disulfide oxidoreductase YuxK